MNYWKARQRKYSFTVILVMIFFVVFFSGFNRLIYSRTDGEKYFRNYSYKEYEHSPQNWGMVQASNGLIYVANHGGVLEFDGSKWRLIALPNYSKVRSLAVDAADRIYVGGQNEFGYLAPNEKGLLEYVSLFETMEKKPRSISNVDAIHVIGHDVYFRAPYFLFRWDSKKIHLYKKDKQIFHSFFCREELFIYQHEIGLRKIVDGTPKKIVGGDLLKKAHNIFMMEPYDSRRLLIGSRPNGFFFYDGNSISPAPLGNGSFPIVSYLTEQEASHGIRLSSGDFAIGTTRSGLIIMDSVGNKKKIFDKKSGLQSSCIKHVFQDKHGTLWICLNKGISKIEYQSPFSIYDEQSGLPGLVVSVVKSGTDLYAGTDNGLYYSKGGGNFRGIPGHFGVCWHLKAVNDGILVAATKGIFQVQEDKVQLLNRKRTYFFTESGFYPGVTWCGTSSGLLTLIDDGKNASSGEKDKKNRWKIEPRFPDLKKSIRSIFEDEQGNLWMGTQGGQIIAIDLKSDSLSPSINVYGDGEGLPPGEIYVAGVRNRVMAATTKGLFRFEKKTGRFIPTQLEGRFRGDLKKGVQVFRIQEDPQKHIWLHSESRTYRFVPVGYNHYKIETSPFLRIPITAQVNAFYSDPEESKTWFPTYDGLIGFDASFKKNYKQEFNTLIRRVLVNDTEIVFEGDRSQANSIFGSNHIPEFKYKRRNFYFEFAAPYFEGESETRYHCLLEGYEQKWSKWKKDTQRNYTNLSPGDYTFRVQARNVYGHLGKEDSFRFRIIPPWYMTWWAFLLYIAVFFALMFVTVKWRAGKLEREKKKLEVTISERTKEISEKNHQLEKKTTQLKEQSEKLEELSQLKSRFFANISHEFRTPLTLIMSPLEQMMDSSRDKEQKETMNLMLRSSYRLLTLINQLLDLSRFDSGKMRLQAARRNVVIFLKGITASFQELAHKNQLRLIFDFQEEDITFFFDPQKMEEVMSNLLINAIKFTPAGGMITVSVSRETDKKEEPASIVSPEGFKNMGDSGYKENEANEKNEANGGTEGIFVSDGNVRISVKDTGIGISSKQMTHIFDRFYQAEGIKERSHKGTGIGLALAKEIVGLHSGIINVHSHEGKGTEFVILLPLGSDHLKAGEIVDDLETDTGYEKSREIEARFIVAGGDPIAESFDEESVVPNDEDSVIGYEDEAGQDIGSEEQKKKAKHTILVVEDDPDVRRYIRGPLEKEFNVEEAVNGEAAIEKARKRIPDLIVSDIMMPGMNGLEMCKRLRGDIETSHIPIILLTAKASDENIVEGLETGADDYITKPFNTKILLTRIKNLIDLRHQFQKKIQRQKMLIPEAITVTTLDEEFFKKFQDTIETNLQDPDFTIDIICERLDMGRSTLFKKIRALTGETPNQFILSYRLERGAQLLKKHYGNVTDVAMKVGFSSPAYFAKCFKEKFHQSPSAFQAAEGDMSHSVV